jgi:hypothetical protein
MRIREAGINFSIKARIHSFIRSNYMDELLHKVFDYDCQ